MTKEEINIAIVEYLGWTKHRNKNSSCSSDIPLGEAMLWEYDFVPPEYNGDINYRRNVPNYCSDYDAIIPVTMDFIKERGDYFYLHYLEEIVFRDAPGQGYTALMVNATPRQRSEAFLKAIDKWK
jgi:hypothetical protein